jgi:D-alanyl-D-alanine carboxypeptidase (penicillin-binding protein 5/6)
VIVVIVALVVIVGAVRVTTETSPRLDEATTAASSYTFPGRAPTPAWPKTGQAALDVPGVGMLVDPTGDRPEPMASLAKMMTAYIVLHDEPLRVGQPGFRVTISAADVADLAARQEQGQSTVPVEQGEVLDEYQLLEGLLIPSGNNIAPILAVHDAGSVTAFVAKMNATARRLGLLHTTYTDPSGFDDTTVSTAADQTRLGRVAMGDPVFARIVAIHHATLPVAGVVTNFDTLAGHDGFLGVKTGSDSTAGGCFVFAVTRRVDGRTVNVYGAVMGQDVGTTLTATLVSAALGTSQRLVASLTPSLTVRTVLPAGSRVAVLTNAQGHRVPAVTAVALTRLGWGGLTVPVRVATEPPGTSLRSGQLVAEVDSPGASPPSTGATATGSMPGLTFGYKLHHLL